MSGDMEKVIEDQIKHDCGARVTFFSLVAICGREHLLRNIS